MSDRAATIAAPPGTPQGIHGFELRPLLWLWPVPLMLILQYTIRWIDPAFYDAWIEPEIGLVELATPALALVGVGFAIAILRRSRDLPVFWLRGWIAVMALGSFYFAGEDLSWGQHFFQWETPERIAQINDQQETNLHNMSSWLDQKPRMALEIFVLFGGIVVPLWLRRTRAWDPRRDWQPWFWPTMVCLPAAVLAGLVSLPGRIVRETGGQVPFPFDIRGSETVEYYYAYFLMLYFISIYVRLKRGDARRG